LRQGVGDKSLTRLSDYDTRGNVNGNFIWK
jgi:hypothetical protein